MGTNLGGSVVPGGATLVIERLGMGGGWSGGTLEGMVAAGDPLPGCEGELTAPPGGGFVSCGPAEITALLVSINEK